MKTRMLGAAVIAAAAMQREADRIAEADGREARTAIDNQRRKA